MAIEFYQRQVGEPMFELWNSECSQCLARRSKNELKPEVTEGLNEIGSSKESGNLWIVRIEDYQGSVSS